LFRAQSEARAKQTSLIDEFVGQAKIVQAYSYESRAAEQFNACDETLCDCALKATFFSSLTNPSTRFVNSTVYAACALVGSFAVIGGSLSVGMLTTMLAYAGQYAKPFNEISGVVTELQNDDLSFSDPLCQRIYDYYCDVVSRGEEPDASVFATADDESLRSFAISLMLDTWRISDTWRTKQVFVPSLEDNLQDDLVETILSFKVKCIDDRIADNARRFRFVTSDEETMALLSEKKILVDLRRQLGTALHRVIN
jgi:ABC-type multidrug transport system fused ATPase/permease subunit